MKIHQLWIDIDGVTPPPKEREYQSVLMECCDGYGVDYHFWDAKSGILDIISSYGIDPYLPMPPVTLSDLARWCVIDTFAKKGELNLYMDMDTEVLPYAFYRAINKMELLQEKTYLAHESIGSSVLDHCAILQSGENNVAFAVVCWLIDRIKNNPEHKRSPMEISHPHLLTPYLREFGTKVDHLSPDIVYPWNFRACSYAPWGENRVRMESAFIHQFRGNWSSAKYERDKRR